jgi:hypothetical protein
MSNVPDQLIGSLFALVLDEVAAVEDFKVALICDANTLQVGNSLHKGVGADEQIA